MAITTAMATSFKSELMRGLHDFGNAAASPIAGDSFKMAFIALGSPQGTYGATSTNYSNITGNSEEAVDTNSPTECGAGGVALTNNGVTTSGTTAFADFADISLTSVTLSADGCMIYNTSNSNSCVQVHNFGSTKTASGGAFTVTFPTADSSNAITRLA